MKFVAAHKFLIVFLIILIGFGFWALQVRNQFFVKDLPTTIADAVFSNSSNSVESSDSALPTDSPSPSDDSVLGVSTSSDNVGGTLPFPTLAPLPTITPIPVPSYTPFPTPSPSSSSSTSSSCGGTPTEDNSQIFVDTKTTQVNSAVNIRVELIDCNNQDTSNDHLTITLTSGDSAVTINGTSSPVNIQAQNGKVSFSVNSPNATTAVFAVKDTDHNLNITAPGYKNPTVTFSTTSTNSCAGTPTAYNSEAVVDNDAKTITIELLDCNNNYAPVSDTLTISQTTSDSTVRINGSPPSVTVQAQNGKTVFTISSQNSGTDTFTVADTTRGFNVTDPNNHNPSLTFNNAPDATPTPSPSSTTSPTPSPSASLTPTPTASASPTGSPTPSASPT